MSNSKTHFRFVRIFSPIDTQMCIRDSTYSESFIENYAKINLIPQVQRVQGVGDANVLGQDYSMRIWLRPDVMAQYKLVPGDVSAALAEQNLSLIHIFRLGNFQHVPLGERTLRRI